MTTPSVADLVGVAEADVYKAGLLAVLTGNVGCAIPLVMSGERLTG